MDLSTGGLSYHKLVKDLVKINKNGSSSTRFILHILLGTLTLT